MELVSAGDRIQVATAIFHSLVSERIADRYRATEALGGELRDAPERIDYQMLRTLLLNAIERDYRVGKEDEQDDPDIAATRAWLLGPLARICAEDAEASKVAISHVRRKTEPHDWARYWTLAGLISARHPQLEGLCRELATDHDDLLISLLATAHLASINDAKAMQRIKKGFEQQEEVWYVARALRIVPLPAAIAPLCDIVNRGDYANETYDAIMALNRVPPNWTQAALAGDALAGFVRKMRAYPWKDGMRTGAIMGLGNLGIETHGPLIIEELTDDNPAIVREAARSIEKVLGLGTTVTRIVEAASKTTSGVDVFGRALRWLDRGKVADELETLMVSGSARQQDVARMLLSELGGAVAFEKLRARTDAMKQYSEMLERTESKVRELFEKSIEEARSGFRYAVAMDCIVFSCGLLLLMVSAGYALFATGDLAKWAGVGLSGGVGVLGVLYGALIANPRKQIRESVDHLMRMKMSFLAYLRRLHQADQAYTRRLLDDEPITVEQVQGYSDIIGRIMTEALKLDSPPPTPPKKEVVQA